MGRAFDWLWPRLGGKRYLHVSDLASPKPSSLENVGLSFVHRIGHGGCFESPSALTTDKQIAVGDTRSSTNCQQLAQDGCSQLAATDRARGLERTPILAAIHYLDRTCRNSRSSATFHYFSISASLLVAKGGTDLPLM
jgi:hypothetical protein